VAVCTRMLLLVALFGRGRRGNPSQTWRNLQGISMASAFRVFGLLLGFGALVVRAQKGIGGNTTSIA